VFWVEFQRCCCGGDGGAAAAVAAADAALDTGICHLISSISSDWFDTFNPFL
jgi:hypothetical protein